MPLRLLVYLTHPHVDAWNWKPRHADQIRQAFPEIEVISCLHSKEFLEQLPSADAVLVWFFKSDWLAKASKLKWICTPAAGMDWIEIPPLENGEAPAPGKPEVWFGGFHGPLMAESVLGAALHFLKALPLSKHMQEKKKWARIKISNQIRSLKKLTRHRFRIWQNRRVHRKSISRFRRNHYRDQKIARRNTRLVRDG